MRKLGIPTVLDRMVQQAVMQVLQGGWGAEFSEHSYGFRPGRSAHQAVAKAQQYVVAGHLWIVDLDLEKFFGFCQTLSVLEGLDQWIRRRFRTPGCRHQPFPLYTLACYPKQDKARICLRSVAYPARRSAPCAAP